MGFLERRAETKITVFVVARSVLFLVIASE
jgi:hypothetical protein